MYLKEQTSSWGYNSIQMPCTCLRSRTASPSFFRSCPDVFQKSSHFSIVSFVSDERPMALKNSCGVEMVSVPGREGVSRRATSSRSRPIPCVWGTGREAARFTKVRERWGRIEDSVREGEAKPVKNMDIFNELTVTSLVPGSTSVCDFAKNT